VVRSNDDAPDTEIAVPDGTSLCDLTRAIPKRRFEAFTPADMRQIAFITSIESIVCL